MELATWHTASRELVIGISKPLMIFQRKYKRSILVFFILAEKHLFLLGMHIYTGILNPMDSNPSVFKTKHQDFF